METIKTYLKKVWEPIRWVLVSNEQFAKENKELAKEIEEAKEASKLLDEPVIFPVAEEPFQFSEKELEDILNDGKKIKPLAKKELKAIDQIWVDPTMEKSRQATAVAIHPKPKAKKPAKKKAAKNTKRTRKAK